jgi:rod shape-determining protein MreD
MTLLTLLFWLIAGGTLQGIVPAWRHMGQPAFPFLLAVVLYAALTKKPRYFVLTALLAGVLEDALSLAPLGTSAGACFAAGGLALLLRADFYADKARTVMWFGALCVAAAAGVMALLLRLEGLVSLAPADVFRRMAGSAILGAVLVPLQFSLMRGLERRLGIWEDRD